MAKTALSKHLAEIGRKGGQVRSAAKAQASRANGKRGGRPRKSNGGNDNVNNANKSSS